MINWVLFKEEWKSNYKILIIFMLILTMYTSIMITMFDPLLGTALDEFAKLMPDIMALVGMNGSTATLVSFMSTYLYGFIMIAFPLIFIVMLSVRLIVSKVDQGFMGYLLSSGNDRGKVIRTQIAVLLSQILALLVYVVCLGIVCGALMFPGDLDIFAYLRLNLGALALYFAFAGICFMFSCIFNETKNAALLGAGIPIVFILIQMLGNMKGDLENLKYATMLTLFDPEGLIAKTDTAFLMLGVLAVIGIVCFWFGSFVFKRKDMSL
ncbi:ABC transporter permease subunit [Clostridiaceae bacterium DONG20-135]|uniref:ABC transporter permease subunit n=1 Tax=Copranaerobaculum intestinale TaxID=2692629 RepID=A0A6N8UBL1_9FIRM|nr:ABC transporter permease subunit [Copranaerobaculum intestinale]MXQ74123.1 ABC transporter permease subunit [Copranaerobaculum intestinale]